MGLVIAIIVLPLLFMLIAAYVVMRFALMLLHLAFLPLTLLRR